MKKINQYRIQSNGRSTPFGTLEFELCKIDPETGLSTELILRSDYWDIGKYINRNHLSVVFGYSERDSELVGQWQD